MSGSRTPRPWHRHIRAAALLTLMALGAPAAAGAATQAEIDLAIQRGTAWMVKQQKTDGSLSGFQGNWAITTLAAGGINAADVKGLTATQSLQDYQFGTYPGSYATLPNTNIAGAFGREALIAASAGIQVTKITPGLSFTASLASKWRVAQGDFGAFAPNSDGFALLATGALHLPKGVRQKIVANLLTAQKTGTTPDSQGRTPFGGWSYTKGATGNGDLDMTGAVLSMLCQEGMTPADAAVANGIDFLHRRLNDQTGGFGTANENAIPPNNVPSAAWAVIGLKACGVDPQGAAWTTSTGKSPVQFILDQQRLPADPADPTYGSFKYLPTTGAPAPSTDMNAAEAGIRALSTTRWLATPPARTDPTQPRLRPAPVVADGTTVPIALSVDDGAGDVRFCAVSIPSGTPLSTVIDTAKTSSIPAGCVADATTTNGVLRTVNAHTPPTRDVQWTARLNDGAAAPAADQPVRFGDVVALEIGAGEPVVAPASVPMGDQPQSTIGSARPVTFTATQAVQIRRAKLTGAGRLDFLIADDGCADATLAPTESCTVLVRYAPGAAGAGSASLGLVAASGSPSTPTLTVALTGTGTSLPAGPAGPAGPVGPAGPAGSNGHDGAPGPAGPAGPAGKDGAVGPAGSNGRDGGAGKDGAAGPAGKDGATGPAGSPGKDGAAGPAGPAGKDGATGSAGPKGDKGARGPRGATGAQGRDASVTCRTGRSRGTDRTVCTLTLVRLSGAPSSRVRLRRASQTYATGRLAGHTTRLTVRAGMRLTKGRYWLVIGSGRSARALSLSFR